jgi:NAD(P)-dependent dehydrogenase (short-subunit alcohol dehydrogenase family)
MVGKILKLGGKTAWWCGKRLAMSYGKDAGIALGVIGAAVVARTAYEVYRQGNAMRGKIVVIVGGSRGLGLEIARQFGLGGAHLVLAARGADELRDALGTLQRQGAIPNGESAHTVVANVSRRTDCERIIASAIERFGRVDVLVNCAAVMQVAPVEDMTTEAFEQAMQINYFGPLYTTQAVLPHMLERGTGNIVNIASVGGKVPVPHMLPYVASKFALVGYSEGLHSELRLKGIRVTTVCPGLMRTGAESGVKFAGDAEKEYRWFAFSANAPGLTVSARAAARKIYAATVAGKAEITITPQAWLGARAFGLAPNLAQFIAAGVNELVLPVPNGNKRTVTGKDLAKG